LIEPSTRAVASAGLENETIDFIHANHYFTMPLVEKIRAGKRIPTILDSHDIQAQQYALRNRDGFFIPRVNEAGGYLHSPQPRRARIFSTSLARNPTRVDSSCSPARHALHRGI
jgi:hypothetical protein